MLLVLKDVVEERVIGTDGRRSLSSDVLRGEKERCRREVEDYEVTKV